MKRAAITVFLTLHFFCGFSQSTIYTHSSTLGIHFGLYDFKNSSPFKKIYNYDQGLSLSYLRGISNHFDWQISVTGSFPDSTTHTISINKQKAFLLESDFSLRARLMGNNRFWQPYFLSGMGLSNYRKNWAAYLLAGPGIELNYKEAFLLVNAQYRFSLTNRLNNHFFYSIGVAGFISKAKKQKKVVLIEPFQKQIIFKDSDKDGIPDSLDHCPNQPGQFRLNGCPDTDGDGIVDNEDNCPTILGFEIYKGCPFEDADKDGIKDEDDRCPYTVGLAKYHGCPVPDKDNDGLIDEEDSCPDVPGLIQNKGCPILKNEINEQISLAAKKIFFKTGSFVLDPQSFIALNDIVEILQEKQSITLLIEGHTDGQGNEVENQILSENRAQAVVAYLIKKNIPKARLTAIGFGLQRPLADNKTSEGRAKNRRVEIKVRPL